MKHSILIIDDEKVGAENLQRVFAKEQPEITCNIAYEEEGIKKSISNKFYDLAIVDLRMDEFLFDGFDLIKEICEINPFARIIIISAYTGEYQEDINEILQTGKIAAILNKEKFDEFSAKVLEESRKIFTSRDNNTNFNQTILSDLYLDVKNENNSQEKGVKFERFIGMLWGSMGFHEIQNRKIDKSQNEIDLIIRNEVDDNFFNKLSPYFFVECKNTIEKIDKNIFIVFKAKIEGSNGLARLGFIITTSGFKRTAYLEALRTSNSDSKIIFISNSEIESLIYSINPLKTLKSIIDLQVKDN